MYHPNDITSGDGCDFLQSIPNIQRLFGIGSSGVPFGSSNSNGKVIIPLNMQGLIAIYDYYYHKEPLIDESKSNLYDYVFQGGIELSWGGLFPLDLDSEDERTKRDILMEALDWKKMFGFCPIKRKYNKTSKQVEFEIPEFGTGIFVFVFDNESSINAKIEFIPFKRNRNTDEGKKKRKRDNNSDRDPSSIQRMLSVGGPIPYSDFDLKSNGNKYGVFVWPGLKPTTYNGALKTVGSKLYSIYVDLQNLKKNLHTADNINSMPLTVIKKAVIPVGNISEMTESEIYGDDEIDEVSTGEAKIYKRDKLAAIMMEQKTDELNGARAANPQDNVQVGFNSKTNTHTYIDKRGVFDDDNKIRLNEGESLDKIATATSTPSYFELKKDYEELVGRSMGVNKEMLGKSSKLKANAEQGRETLEISVKDERSAAALFYQWSYDFIHRGQEDRKIAELLQHLDEEKKEVELMKKLYKMDTNGTVETLLANNNDGISNSDINSRGGATNNGFMSKDDLISKSNQIDFNQKMLLQVAHDKFRLRLTFPKNPFSTTAEMKDIQVAISEGVLTPQEQINVMRAKIGLDKLSADHELVKAREKISKLTHTAQEHELKLAATTTLETKKPPGGGGGASSSKSK